MRPSAYGRALPRQTISAAVLPEVRTPLVLHHSHDHPEERTRTSRGLPVQDNESTNDIMGQIEYISAYDASRRGPARRPARGRPRGGRGPRRRRPGRARGRRAGRRPARRRRRARGRARCATGGELVRGRRLARERSVRAWATNASRSRSVYPPTISQWFRVARSGPRRTVPGTNGLAGRRAPGR